jgi:hypothetical protein
MPENIFILYKISYNIYVIFEAFRTIDMKNAVFWVVRRVALVRTDVSEERSASIIRMTRIDDLRTSAVTSFFAVCVGC